MFDANLSKSRFILSKRCQLISDVLVLQYSRNSGFIQFVVLFISVFHLKIIFETKNACAQENILEIIKLIHFI